MVPAWKRSRPGGSRSRMSVRHLYDNSKKPSLSSTCSSRRPGRPQDVAGSRNHPDPGGSLWRRRDRPGIDQEQAPDGDRETVERAAGHIQQSPVQDSRTTSIGAAGSDSAYQLYLQAATVSALPAVRSIVNRVRRAVSSSLREKNWLSPAVSRMTPLLPAMATSTMLATLSGPRQKIVDGLEDRFPRK